MRRRVVIVHRRTELEELLGRHGTRGQAEFFLKSRGRTLDQVQHGQDALQEAVAAIRLAVPQDWVTVLVERTDLARFLFAPEDLVFVVGQDGLVANTAKYVDAQPVIGVDPEKGQNPGVLVRFSYQQAVKMIATLAQQPDALPQLRQLTMVEGLLDDGQRICALNELFVGHQSHQSARYVVDVGGRQERQSSSGLLVGTGTGATGWLASLSADRGGRNLPTPIDPALAWFVREAWPSPNTGATLTEGIISGAQALEVRVESDQLVVFGDGIEHDRLLLGWGQTLRIQVAKRSLNLAV